MQRSVPCGPNGFGLAAEGVAVRAAAMQEGLVLGMAGPRKNILKVKPPLIVNSKECDEILDKLRNALTQVFRK